MAVLAPSKARSSSSPTAPASVAMVVSGPPSGSIESIWLMPARQQALARREPTAC
jgi:hypothetical protein